MKARVCWSCTEVPQSDAGEGRGAESKPLREFRDRSAYALLGDPGSGKTNAFEAECDALGGDSHCVTARDFLTFEPHDHPEWSGKTLFIDGLDEVRVGSADVCTPFDTIRQKLDALGKPRFRLSCREADWLGANDTSRLERVSPDSRVTVLRLDPLADEDIERILDAHPDVYDTRKFLAAAKENGVEGFLRNPQNLDLLAKAVGRAGSWPASRLELFEAACRRMVREHNAEHLAAARSSAGPPSASVENLLDAAGRLCAVQLIAGVAGFAVTDNAERGDFPGVERCGQTWNGTHVADQRPGVGGQLLRAALATKLFSAHSPERFCPIHRHVAEFLGARHLARLIEGGTQRPRNARRGLPVRRVIALMTGHDGMVVTELRGLSAWLAAQCRLARVHLIERDPIGVGLYGDVSQFSTAEQHALLTSLQAQASRLVPAQRTAGAFRALAKPEMVEAFSGFLTDSSRAHEHQVFVHFLVYLLARSSPLPELAEVLLRVVRDETWLPDIKAAALAAFIHNAPNAQEKALSLRALLTDVQGYQISDPDDDLLGILLTQLHPEKLSPSEVWAYLSESSHPVYGGSCYRFWKFHLVDESAASPVADHLDALAARHETLWPALESRGLRDVPIRLLARGLEAHGDRIETSRLYDWLGAGLISDLGKLPDDSLGRVRRWLRMRPAIQKATLIEGLERLTGLDDNGFRRRADEIERRLYGADPPSDFGRWCLEQAEAATDQRVSGYLLQHSLNAVHALANGGGLSLDILESRAQKNAVLAGIYAEARRRRERATDRAASRYLRRQLHLNAEEEGENEERLAYVRSHEAALRDNRCPPALLHQLAAAYFGLLTDATGDTPGARLRNLFLDDERLAQAALAGIRGTILRDDLPDVGEIIRLRGENREHYLALPTLASLAELESTTPRASTYRSRSRRTGIPISGARCTIS